MCFLIHELNNETYLAELGFGKFNEGWPQSCDWKIVHHCSDIIIEATDTKSAFFNSLQRGNTGHNIKLQYYGLYRWLTKK